MKSEIFKIKSNDGKSSICGAYRESCSGEISLCDYYMKTIPELCVEEIIIYNLEALPCGIRYRL